MIQGETTLRHLTVENLREYLQKEVSTGLLVPGSPRVYIDIDAPRDRLTLRIEGEAQDVPDLSEFRHFRSDYVLQSGEHWVMVTTRESGEVLETYPLYCAIADRVQIDKFAISAAVKETFKDYRELLSGAGRMSDDAEVGLIGELLFLKALIKLKGAATAVDAWRGPLSEEHDFSLDRLDLEVKTTTSEKRLHWISSLEQLQPTKDRTLWLLSIQLTTAGQGGLTLPELVQTLRSALPAHNVQETFNFNLRDMGWRDENTPLYKRRFRLRTAPAYYSVSPPFPALTAEGLSASGVALTGIPRLIYQVDITHLTPAAMLPDELGQAELGAPINE